MKKIGIYYGSSMGTTREVAYKIAQALNVGAGDVLDVSRSAPSSVAMYDVLVFGSSTWGNGDMQTDWYDFLDGLEALDLSSKKVALFGCGDETMSQTFCNAVGELYQRVRDAGAEVLVPYPARPPYAFSQSAAVDDLGMGYGLLLDNVNHPDLTDGRIKDWTNCLKQKFEQEKTEG